MHETYFNLVREFPLLAIHSGEELTAASARCDEVLKLMDRTEDEGVAAYLDALSDLVWCYEQQHESWSEAS